MKTPPQVVMISLWRDDEGRQLRARAAHLLSKSYPNLRWLWIVGDSVDRTYDMLSPMCDDPKKDIMVALCETESKGMDQRSRLRRLSDTVNIALDEIEGTDDVILLHESDIVSPVDVVERMVAVGKIPLACWPTITLGGRKLCYDIWAIRKDGVLFTNHPPYHSCYRADQPFEVDSFGTVYMFPAANARAGMRAKDRACLDLCSWSKQHGQTLWVDPRIEVVQPVSLWTPHPVTA